MKQVIPHTADHSKSLQRLDVDQGAALLGFALCAVSPPLPAPDVWFAAVGLGLLLRGCVVRHTPITHAALGLSGSFCLVQCFPDAALIWPVPLLFCLMVVSAVLAFKGHAVWLPGVLRKGELGVTDLPAIGFISVVSTLGLISWLMLRSPDLSALTRQIPDVGLLAIIGFAVGFAMINAALEEIIWRGVMLNWLIGFTPIWLAICLQGLSFGAAHAAGFPSGVSGIGLATVYGVMLGMLAHKTRGLFAPVAAHVVADLVIFVLLYGQIR